MFRYLIFALLIGTFSLSAQVTFTDATSNLNYNTLYSGVAISVADMNGDGLDDIVRFLAAQDLRIDYQTASGNFTGYAQTGNGSVWGMSIADIDKNGYNDVLSGGAYNRIDQFLANSNGSSYTRTFLGGPNIFVQNVNFADINNDGAIDFFACHDDGISSPYQNDGSGTLTHTAALINTASTVPSDNSGNYGSIWTDYDDDGDLDLFISKCRLGVSDPNDGRRLNLLFQNDGSNNFTEVAPAANLQPGRQSWATVFGDLDNDGDQDAVMLNHGLASIIYSNDGDGTFTDITSTSGISTEIGTNLGLGIQVIMADFDNDTYLDFLCTTRSGIHYLFYNDGDMTFTPSSPFFSGTTDIQSGASGDLNNDGFVDIIAGFASGYNGPASSRPDKLYLNNANSNNWSKVKLTGVESNINAIGAKVILEGVWGQQMREIRAGESYGTQNSMIAHFGLGTATEITKVIVEWPSGIVDEILSPRINELINIEEGETCQSITVWDGSNWSNGVPNYATNVIISGDYSTLDQGDLYGCTLIIENPATLTVTENHRIQLTNDLTLDLGAEFSIRDNASFVQINDGAQVVNNGTIKVFKQTPSLDNRDFMIVGSPMSSSTKTGVFPAAIQFRNHLTNNFNADPDVTAADGAALNFADAEGDNWLPYSGMLNPGEGYLVMPQTTPTVPDGQTYLFEYNQGTLNNGFVIVPVLFGDDTNDSPNILSNPYASAIDGDLFLTENAALATVLYFWDHATAPSTSYPGYNVANYDMGDISQYSIGSGGVAGNGGIIPDGSIASGQGFAIKALTAGNATFNNSMRVVDNSPGFKSLPDLTRNRDRIWLEVHNQTYGLKSQALIAFTTGATAEFEPFYDATRLASPVSLYSTSADADELSIQGLSAFNEDVRVNLGFRTQIQEPQDYSISLVQMERFLMDTETDVFLLDKTTGQTTNLSKQKYSFKAEAGNFSERFELFFSDRFLNIDSFKKPEFVLSPNPADTEVNLVFDTAFDRQINIYDLSGRVIQQLRSTEASVLINTAALRAGIYFVQVGDTTKKLIIK